MVKVRYSKVACISNNVLLSDEVQALNIVAKVRMRDGDRSQVATFSSVTDQVS